MPEASLPWDEETAWDAAPEAPASIATLLQAAEDAQRAEKAAKAAYEAARKALRKELKRLGLAAARTTTALVTVIPEKKELVFAEDVARRVLEQAGDDVTAYERVRVVEERFLDEDAIRARLAELDQVALAFAEKTVRRESIRITTRKEDA